MPEEQSSQLAMLNRIGAPILVLEVKSGVGFGLLLANLAAEKHYGETLQQYNGRAEPGKTVGDFGLGQIHRSFANCKRCLISRSPIVGTVKCQLPDGAEGLAQLSHVPVFNECGEVQQVIVTIIEIGDIRKQQMKATLDTIGAPITIIDVDPDGIFSWWVINKAAESHFGLAHDEFSGLEMNDFRGLSEARTQQRKRTIGNYQRCIDAGKAVFNEARYLQPDGITYRWGHNTFVPIFDFSGDIRQIMVTTVDVTELIETQQDLRTIIEAAGAPLYFLDVSAGGKLSFAMMNEAAERYIRGLSPEYQRSLTDYLTNKKLSERQHSLVSDIVDQCQKCIESKKPVFGETRHARSDGSYSWGRNTFIPIMNDLGDVRQVMVTTVDITELIETQHEMKLVIDSIGAPIMIHEVMTDESFPWKMINSAAEQLFGFKNNELAGQALNNFEGLDEFRVAQRKRVIEELRTVVDTKAPLVYELEYVRRDNSYQWARNTLIPIFDAVGDMKQIMVTSLDISELIDTQKHLESSQKQLEEALTKTLSGFVKICANCKQIHHDNEWQPIEQYAAEQMDYHEFSHGMCGECARKLYGDDILDS